ncbi:Scr1 family TA system antitoxin-like transcriptional regulator [Streptomyces sp. NPDC088789]|uniref:helix-turn-helix domain-containing protein n=1 Tax=Streptomyces sp. NPDC088789 TaxID=3365899 RepID=UPI00380EF2D3
MSDETEPYIADDEEAAAVLRTVGRVIKMFRERKGLTQAELGTTVGYSEEQVSAVERGRRSPSLKFLESADEALEANGIIVGLRNDVEQAKYPKQVRDLTRYEADATESCAYTNTAIHGLLQTPEYARAVYAMRRPPYPDAEVERLVQARVTRQNVFDQEPAPVFSFVQEEATLRRPFGGRMVLRKQLEHLLEMGQRRNVDIQVMPMDLEDHASASGSIRLLRLVDGDVLAHKAAPFINRLYAQPKEVQIFQIRYGMIRAQALTPRDSMAFIEKVLGET